VTDAFESASITPTTVLAGDSVDSTVRLTAEGVTGTVREGSSLDLTSGQTHSAWVVDAAGAPSQTVDALNAGPGRTSIA
jgi:hypothetical protein